MREGSLLAILTRMLPDSPRSLKTSLELSAIRTELSQRGPIFHCVELGTTRADRAKMTADDFREFGASGRRYSCGPVLDELERRYSALHDDSWETTGLLCQKLVTDVFLLMYPLVQFMAGQKLRGTRRATIWQRSADGWKSVYHQGTIIQND